MALLVGGGTGLLGTLLHLQLTWIGSVMVPWGALLALLLVASAQLWATLSTGKPWVGALTVVLAYLVAGFMAFGAAPDIFNVPINSYMWQMIPGPMIAEILWLLGVPVLAVVVLVITTRLLADDRPVAHRYTQATPTPDED